MKLKAAIALFLLLAAGRLARAAEDGMTVAVYDFTGEAETAGFNHKVTALVTADLAADTNLVMLERAQLNQSLSEQAFGASGMVSSAAAARIGAMTGARVLVSGQVIMTEENHVVIIANIIGTESAHLFAATVEGFSGKIMDLTAELSAKIARTIVDQATNLVLAPVESSSARLERIVKSAQGTNRPAVSIYIHWSFGEKFSSAGVNTELGLILQKAGFLVVDHKSEKKPDVEITGVVELAPGQVKNGLYSEHSLLELKARDRRTGRIIALDRQESVTINPTRVGAKRAAEALVVDDMADRVLPLLAK